MDSVITVQKSSSVRPHPETIFFAGTRAKQFGGNWQNNKWRTVKKIKLEHSDTKKHKKSISKHTQFGACKLLSPIANALLTFNFNFQNQKVIICNCVHTRTSFKPNTWVFHEIQQNKILFTFDICQLERDCFETTLRTEVSVRPIEQKKVCEHPFTNGWEPARTAVGGRRPADGGRKPFWEQVFSQ